MLVRSLADLARYACYSFGMGVLDGLRFEICALQEIDTACLSNQELGDTLVELQELKARLCQTETRLTSVFDRRGAYRDDGSRSPAVWLSRRSGCSVDAARSQVRLARQLRVAPLAAQALAEGRITPGHAEVLGRLATNDRIADQYGRSEALLVGFAIDLDFDKFQAALRYWQQQADEDGAEDKAADNYSARHLHASRTFDGNVGIDGQLDPVGGSEFLDELARLEQHLFEEDWAAAKEIHGEDTRVEHLARTPGQRRADAVAMMARRSAIPGEGEEPRPLFVAHVGYPDPLVKLCELADGTVVTPRQLAPFITEADIERIVYEPGSRRIADLGRKSRFFTGGLRRAIQLRDRHCQWPGCRVPAERCDVDHIDPWSAGGETNQDNGQPNCGPHNRHKADTPPQPPDHDP
jgi:hypothetical protein